MMPNRSSSLLRQLYKGLVWNRQFCSTAPTTDSYAANNRDPAPIFFSRRIQDLLSKLTRIDYEKVFAHRKIGKRLSTSKYVFMTDEDLQEAQEKLEEKAKKRIQMPPVVKARDKTVEILSKDYGIQGFDDSNFVFTDISFGTINRDRLIVMREPSGILRHANYNERHRLNQVYFPVKEREIETPKMFFNPYFDDLLKREEFLFILDRACLQFDPDHPDYQKITQQVYDKVNELKKFDVLRSTRHFGPMAFYLAWENKIDNLLEDVIINEKIEEAIALIQVYNTIHPNTKRDDESTMDNFGVIRSYIKLDSSDGMRIQRALETYEFLEKERQIVKDSIEKSHGRVKKTDEPKT